MKVCVIAFATASEALGGESCELEIPAGSRIADLEAILVGRFPALASLWPRLAVAIDGELVDRNAPLSAGVEVALLPPVSGGAPRGPNPRSPRLTHHPIDGDRIAASVRHPSRGAVLIFRGDIRDHHQGRPVERLTYSAYDRMAEARLDRIIRELEAGGDNLRVAITHRLGEVAAGETSVIIAVASPHREAAYAASRSALERLKKEVPIWKREHFADGAAQWREVESLDSTVAPLPESGPELP